MEEEVTATRSSLEAAFRRWEEQAKAEGWPERTDEQRHADNADFMFGLLKG